MKKLLLLIIGIVFSFSITCYAKEYEDKFDEVRYINDKDRIAQVIFIKYPKVKLKKAKQLSLTKRGIKGFGSTGNK